MSDRPLTDAHDRKRAEEELGTCFAVEAAAGAGKTTVLVTRLLNLIRTGTARLDRVVAVTFTEKAAGELKMRVREEIEKALAGELDGGTRERFDQALDDLGHAPIGTIHAFCSGLLRERPVEASVDPQFQVADELTASLLRESVWSEWLEAELAARNPALIRAIAHGLKLDGPGHTLLGLAGEMFDCRDLLDGRPRPTPGGTGFRDFIAFARPKLAVLVDQVTSYAEGDTAEKYRSKLEDAHRKLILTDGLGDPQAEAVVMRLAFPARPLGKANWTRKGSYDGAKELHEALKARLDEVQGEIGRDVAAAAGDALAGFVGAYQRAKDDEGLLDFTDLLLVTRHMLAASREARDHFKRRYDFLLVDEFQDTDPLQVEIAFFLAERPDRHAADWQQVELAPGKLFIVGDPKQSIYRFRRADIEIYERAKHHIRRQGGELVLSQSFRPSPGLAEAVNNVFEPIIQKPAEGDYQPGYVALQPFRSAASERAATLLVYPPPSVSDEIATADSARRVEANCVAALIRRIVDEECWPVYDKAEKRVRPAQYGDIALLAERFLYSDTYAEALAAAGVPIRVIGGKHFYTAHEVHSLVAVLKAIDNPHDRLSLVAALRGPFFGVSDDELLVATCERGPLSYAEKGHHGPPATRGTEAPPTPLDAAMAVLRDFHGRRNAEPLPLLLQRLYERAKVLELLHLRPRGEQRVANLLKIVERARALEATERVTFRGFVRWLARLHETEAREPESPSSEAGENYVQFLSVHGAKGLEFPIVLLVDMTKDKRNPNSFVVFRDHRPEQGQFAFYLGGDDDGFQTSNWPGKEHEVLRNDAERARLFYVAATRARDYLLLFTGWGGGKGGPAAFLGDLAAPAAPAWGRMTRAGYVFDTRSLDLSEVAGEPFRVSLPDAAGNSKAVANRLAAREQWQQETAALLARACLGTVSRTPSHIHEGIEAPRDEAAASAGSDLGRRIGVLVHGCLKRAALDDAATLQALLRADARALGLPAEAERRAARLLQTALDSPLLRRARASAACYHEVPFSVKVGGVTLAGSIDLLFVEKDGAVVVDFKTDAVGDSDDLRRLTAAYGPQVRAYALATQMILCKPVQEVVLFFLSAGHEWRTKPDEAMLRVAKSDILGGR